MACPECGGFDHIAVAQENGSLWVECLQCGNVWKLEKEERDGGEKSGGGSGSGADQGSEGGIPVGREERRD